jgi:NitT/TauT family transport system permease protein
VTALRITIPAALIGAIIGEFISANRGVGYLINAASSRYATAEVFAGILSLLIVVLLMNAALSAVERRWLRWAPRPETAAP